ncbi:MULTISPECIES: recombinase family protein [unclassified Cupriavidus]|uniref:recombinase family protein n=1 Tax=Cupriavidus sp. H19C3 TaxID=3241603 RepID=UPI003BF909C4
MPSTFIYTNNAAELSEFEAEIKALDEAGVIVDLRHAWWERSRSTLAALERPQLQRLLQRVRAGDTVITLRLDSLGRNLGDVLATIDRLRALEVKLRCVELGDDDLAAPSPSLSMKTLLAVCRLERLSRSRIMKQSAAAASERGRRLGRKPAVATTMHDDIRAALRHGASVTELARTFHVSRQTIMRIRDAAGR